MCTTARSAGFGSAPRHRICTSSGRCSSASGRNTTPSEDTLSRTVSRLSAHPICAATSTSRVQESGATWATRGMNPAAIAMEVSRFCRAAPGPVGRITQDSSASCAMLTRCSPASGWSAGSTTMSSS